MKKSCLVIALFIAVLVFYGCANQERTVRVMDEKIHEENRLRFYELDEYFKETYTKENRKELYSDEFYDEYERLMSIVTFSGTGNNSEYTNVQAMVDLEKQTIQYGEDTIHYEISDGEIQFNNSQTPLLDSTLRALVVKARGEYQEDRSYNISLLLRTAWMPILIGAIGILSLARPRWVWWAEDGYKYKNAEPSSFSLGLNTFRGVIAIGLALFIAVLILRNLR